MTLLRNSEVNNFTYINIDMETESVISYSCFNYYLFYGMYIHIYIREVHYFLIGFNERLYRFEMKTL